MKNRAGVNIGTQCVQNKTPASISIHQCWLNQSTTRVTGFKEEEKTSRFVASRLHSWGEERHQEKRVLSKQTRLEPRA